jgi:hypothetical protein
MLGHAAKIEPSTGVQTDAAIEAGARTSLVHAIIDVGF